MNNRTKSLSIGAIFDILYSTYGPQDWWPGETQFEIIVGAVLTQSTAWHNVTQAIDNLKRENLLEFKALLEAEPDHVRKMIAPTGFFNVKYKRLRSVLEYFARYNGNFGRLKGSSTADLRNELLKVNGVGPETADSILLYAFERPTFVVDAYTRRLFSRLGYLWMEKASYEEIQRHFMMNLPADTALYNEYHALIVVQCKSVCKKRPVCSDCDLLDSCLWPQAAET